MIGPEGDSGIIPRFCQDLVVQGNCNTDSRVWCSCIECFTMHWGLQNLVPWSKSGFSVFFLEF